jgi:hypothetical protein
MNFFIHLILPAALGHVVYSASKRNEYHKQKNNTFIGSRERPMRRQTTLPPSGIRFSGQCEILNISQPYRIPQPVAGTALLLITSTVETASLNNLRNNVQRPVIFKHSLLIFLNMPLLGLQRKYNSMSSHPWSRCRQFSLWLSTFFSTENKRRSCLTPHHIMRVKFFIPPQSRKLCPRNSDLA